MSNFYSFPGVEDPPTYSSVILPSCNEGDAQLIRTFDPAFIIIHHVAVFSKEKCIGLDVMQVFSYYSWKQKPDHIFLNSMCRFAQFREYPGIIFISHSEGVAYQVNPISREKVRIGNVAYRDQEQKICSDNDFTIFYGNNAREIGHYPLMMLGHLLATKPGLAECRDSRVPMEEVMKIKASGKVKRRY